MTQAVTVQPSDDIVHKGFDPQLTRRLAKFARPYSLPLLASLGLMLLNSAAAVLGPYLVQVAIDSGMQGGDIRILIGVCLLYFLTIAIQWSIGGCHAQDHLS